MCSMKHNWAALKTAYITGDIRTVAEFARINGIPANTINKHTKGWLKEKAEYMQNICNKTEEELEKKAVEEKVISAQKRKECISEVLRGTMDQWARIRNKIAMIEAELKDQPVSQKMLSELRKVQATDTKIMPDLIRCLELLDGGATSRTDTVIDGKRTKDMTEDELYEAEERLAEEVLRKKEKENE